MLQRLLRRWSTRAGKGHPTTPPAVYSVALRERRCVPESVRRVSPQGHFWQPMVSPDGAKIAFWGREPDEPGQHLWIADARAQSASRLTQGTCIFGHPYWFADSQRIACFGTPGASEALDWRASAQFEPERAPAHLWIVDTVAGERQRVTDGPHADERPAVSPDGTWLCFVSNRAGRMNLWRVDVDGLNLRQLTSGVGPDYRPSISPSGDRVAYFTPDGDGRHQLALIGIDGGDPRMLTTSARFRWVHGPQWLADGSTLLVHALARNETRPRLWWFDVHSQVAQPLDVPGFSSCSHGSVDRAVSLLACDSRERA